MNQYANDIQTPLFSIIMPAYNVGTYIAKSIASVMAQTYPNWELIIMDDASTDNTEAVVRDIAMQEPRIRYERLPAMRVPSKVRNAGFQRARGQYVTFLDADDLYEPYTLQTFANYFRKNPQTRAVYGQYVEIDKYDQEIASEYSRKPLTPTWETLLSAKTHHQLQALAMEHTLFNEIGGFSEEVVFGEDWMFYIRLMEHLGNQLCSIPTTVFRYRIYDDSVSRDDKRALAVMHSYDNLCHWFKDANLCKDARKHLSNLIAAHYVYFLKVRVQRKQWTILLIALLRTFFNLDLKMKDWLRCVWVCIKTMLPKHYQTRIGQYKSIFHPTYKELRQSEI